jgi:hypothetical protein
LFKPIEEETAAAAAKKTVAAAKKVVVKGIRVIGSNTRDNLREATKLYDIHNCRFDSKSGYTLWMMYENHGIKFN